MHEQSIKKPSRYLVPMLISIAVLLILGILMILRAYNATRQDLELINNIGRIRGGIQRVLVALSLDIDSEVASESLDSYLSAVEDTLHDEEFEQIRVTVKNITALMEKELTPADKQFIYNSSKYLWDYTDTIVEDYIHKSDEKRRLFLWGIGILVLMFITVIIYAALFFRLITKELEPEAIFDTLTGILRRGRFIDHLMANITTLGRGEFLGLLMYDLDHFKHVNDTYGHDVGDKVLKETVDAVVQVLRIGDVMGRLGGEEFAILVRSKDRRAARLLADRVRAAVEHTEIPELPGGITASVGVIGLKPNDTAESALKRVDEFLYAAKSAGRNRVRGD